MAAALAAGRPVVALESTIISHGMPYPQNLETAREVEGVVRAHGAVPATIAVLGGVPHVGLTAAQLERLARGGTAVRKVSRRDLPHTVALRMDGATTVSATMLLAARAGIPVFVTGGGWAAAWRQLLAQLFAACRSSDALAARHAYKARANSCGFQHSCTKQPIATPSRRAAVAPNRPVCCMHRRRAPRRRGQHGRVGRPDGAGAHRGGGGVRGGQVGAGHPAHAGVPGDAGVALLLLLRWRVDALQVC